MGCSPSEKNCSWVGSSTVHHSFWACPLGVVWFFPETAWWISAPPCFPPQTASSRGCRGIPVKAPGAFPPAFFFTLVFAELFFPLFFFSSLLTACASLCLFFNVLPKAPSSHHQPTCWCGSIRSRKRLDPVSTAQRELKHPSVINIVFRINPKHSII